MEGRDKVKGEEEEGLRYEKGERRGGGRVEVRDPAFKVGGSETRMSEGVALTGKSAELEQGTPSSSPTTDFHPETRTFPDPGSTRRRRTDGD